MPHINKTLYMPPCAVLATTDHLLLALLRLQILVSAESKSGANEHDGVEADAGGGAVRVGDRGVRLSV